MPDLSGQRIVITRATAQAGTLTHALQAAGATVIACPTIAIEPPATWTALDQALAQIQQYDWLLFTSANAVTMLLQRLRERGLTNGHLAHLRIGVVGKPTAAHVQAAGLPVAFTPKQFSAATFAAAFSTRFALAGQRALLPVSDLASDELRVALSAQGMHVDVVIAYRTTLPPLSAAQVIARVRDPLADWIVFTSGSTVGNLAQLVAPLRLAELLQGVRVACLGPVTAAALRQFEVTVDAQASAATVDDLVACLCQQNRMLE